MTTLPTIVSLRIRTRVLTPKLLVQEARVRSRNTVKATSVVEALKVLCNAPAKAPAGCGYEVLSIDCTLEPGTAADYALAVKAQVHDAARLFAEAADAYERVWGDRITFSDPAQAVYELILASNDNPSPADMGFAILGSVEGPAETTHS